MRVNGLFGWDLKFMSYLPTIFVSKFIRGSKFKGTMFSCLLGLQMRGGITEESWGNKKDIATILLFTPHIGFPCS